MSVEQLIQIKFKKELEKKKQQSMILGNLANNSYSGVIRDGGETVKIIEESEVTLHSSLGLDGGPVAYNDLNPTAQEMRIDKDPYVDFRLSKPAMQQIQSGDAKAVMDEAFTRSYYLLEKEVEDDLAGLYTDSGLVYTSSTVTITKSNAYEYLNRMATLFNRNNLDKMKSDWAAVLPPEYISLLELDAINSGVDAGYMKRINGWQGQCAGFNIYSSNSIAEDGNDLYHPLFIIKGQSLALAMAQEPEVKDTTRTNYFEKAYAIRQLYGVKGYRPDKIGTFPCNFSYA